MLSMISSLYLVNSTMLNITAPANSPEDFWFLLLCRVGKSLLEAAIPPRINLLVNISGFNASLNWTNSCEWLNVFTNAGHLFIHRGKQRSAPKTWNNIKREITRMNRYKKKERRQTTLCRHRGWTKHKSLRLRKDEHVCHDPNREKMALVICNPKSHITMHSQKRRKFNL
jgi:hypothetical protein